MPSTTNTAVSGLSPWRTMSALREKFCTRGSSLESAALSAGDKVLCRLSFAKSCSCTLAAGVSTVLRAMLERKRRGHRTVRYITARKLSFDRAGRLKACADPRMMYRVGWSMSLRGLSILILEDEPLIALDLARAFRAEEAQATLASSIEAGARLLESRRFDACVLDLWLKGRYVDGLIKVIDRKAIPYVIYSGWSLPADLRSAIYVPKPKPADDVIDAIAARMLRLSA
ncbi:MAG: response regulator [Hyphomicrobiales bacterium]|nr:MAG: response regulator [Hyphomicrobiales bacterium]